MDATHYPANYDDQQHGRDLVAVIRKGDMLELFNGNTFAAASTMSERALCDAESDFIVSAWIPIAGSQWGMPINHNAIVAIWRNRVCIYRMGKLLPQQMELFRLEQAS